MARHPLFAPRMILAVGFVLMGGAVLTKYNSLFELGPHTDVSQLISLALGDSGLPLPHGDSVLSTKGVVLSATSGETASETPGLARKLYSGPWASAGEPAGESQPIEWALGAAAQDPAALRAWLGWAVLSMAATDGDTVRLRMYRLRLRTGCPMIDRIEAALTRPAGSWETKIARIDGGCWK